MRVLAILLLLILLVACSKPTFQGKLMLEHQTLQEMLANPLCQTAWDLKPGQWASACSWTFRDDTGIGCHIVYVDAAGLDEELHNCASVDQRIMERNDR